MRSVYSTPTNSVALDLWYLTSFLVLQNYGDLRLCHNQDVDHFVHEVGGLTALSLIEFMEIWLSVAKAE